LKEAKSGSSRRCYHGKSLLNCMIMAYRWNVTEELTVKKSVINKVHVN
jgi:hypothetical protein